MDGLTLGQHVPGVMTSLVAGVLWFLPMCSWSPNLSDHAFTRSFSRSTDSPVIGQPKFHINAMHVSMVIHKAISCISVLKVERSISSISNGQKLTVKPPQMGHILVYHSMPIVLAQIVKFSFTVKTLKAGVENSHTWLQES